MVRLAGVSPSIGSGRSCRLEGERPRESRRSVAKGFFNGLLGRPAADEEAHGGDEEDDDGDGGHGGAGHEGGPECDGFGGDADELDHDGEAEGVARVLPH
jgi:hypothetical protein